MKVLIVGYGKMGKEIHKILDSRNHQLMGKIDSAHPLSKEIIKGVDVAIDFSTPSVVLENIHFLVKNHIPVVVGTTGWYDALSKVEEWIKEEKGSMVHATNFSIGVNLFFGLNKHLAHLMGNYPDYQPKITEIHHTEKLDAPSGTAITLANELLEEYPHLKDWYCLQNENKNEKSSSKLEIEAIREPNIKGTHTINYTSEIDTISIEHRAFSRKGFALGSVIAAEWLINKQGIFTMKDVLQLS